MTSSFKVEPGALTTAGKVFADQVDDVNSVSTTAQNLNFDSGHAGKGYRAQGTAYQQSMQKLITTLLSPMAAKVSWVGVTLNTTAGTYAKQDDSASTGVTNAGRGA